MTKFSINTTSDLKIIEIWDHAGYSDNGYDIVCASISTAVYMTRNFIEVIEPGYNLSNILLEEGHSRFEVSVNFNKAIKALETLEFALLDLEKQYPDYIRKVK